MSTEENKAIVRRSQEALNQRNWTLFYDYLAEDFVEHGLPAGTPPGRAGVQQAFEQYLAAFPDLQFTIEDQLAEGDTVVSRMTSTGTHTGDFGGLPATGKRVTSTGIDMSRIVDGKFVETWAVWDTFGLLQQLEALPAPSKAPA